MAKLQGRQVKLDDGPPGSPKADEMGLVPTVGRLASEGAVIVAAFGINRLVALFADYTHLQGEWWVRTILFFSSLYLVIQLIIVGGVETLRVCFTAVYRLLALLKKKS